MLRYRSLKENELDQWFSLCASVFTVPKSYFQNHYYNDPWRCTESVFIAEEGDQMVSTVRVFHRNIYINKRIISMGGIGEVCTLPEYRNRGISTELLKMAINYMKNMGFIVSSLGASVISHYAKLGWQPIERKWNISKVKASFDIPFSVRKIDLLSQKQMSLLMEIYDKYSSQFNGPIARNDEYYWRNWIAHEIKKQTGVRLITDFSGKPVAYIIYSIVKDMLIIKEFACLDEIKGIFESIVSHIVYLHGYQEIYVKYPFYITSSFRCERIDVSDGYMIKILIDEDNEEYSDVIKEIQNNHLFWDLDGF